MGTTNVATPSRLPLLKRPRTGQTRAQARGSTLPGQTNAGIVWSARLALLIMFLAGWAALSASSSHWNRILSSPTAVGRQLIEWISDSAFRVQVGATLTEATLGYFLGILLALGLIALVAPSRFLDRLLKPFIIVCTVIPYLALAPMFMIWFGLTLRAKVYFVAAAIFVIVFYALHSGLKTIDKLLIDNQRILGASRFRLLTEIYFPAIFGWLMSSLRLSAAWALLAAVLSEYLGSTQGLGFLISQGESSLDSTTVIAGITIVALIALAIDRVLVRVERRYSSWRTS
ncbi:ABC transporter permease [Rhodococcus globerulus]|uniref:ABC transporter permease n=1 Tax=Rhodococcus globerulus TaxID=33008 RepID=UPI00374F625A